MKALKVVATTILTVAVLGAQVLAAGTGSPVAGDGPKVKKAILASGKDVTGFIVTTQMGTTSPYDGVNESLKSAAADFKAANEKAAALKGSDGKALESALVAAAQKQVSGATADDLKNGAIFDTSYIENGKVEKLGESITITYEYDIPSGTFIVPIHQTASGVWAVMDFKVSGNEISVTSDGLSPFAFITGKASEKKDDKKDDGKKSAQTGEYVTKTVLAGAVVLAAVGIVCATRAKKSSAK
ncbi:MAG: hypothetical protein IK020_07595 [Clostridiales bacterium]|nr:hypothetical protein [Clostridiales bacterium]